MGDVRARAAAAYVQLQQQLTDPLERRVLLGAGLPARAPLAVPRQAPATAARRGGDTARRQGGDAVSSEEESESEPESEPEGSGGSDDQGSDGGEGGEGGEQAADGVPPPDHYELTCLSYGGDVLTLANPRGYGVTVERWERPRQGGTRTITYAGEHMLDAEGERKREGHGTERCELYKKGAARMQGQWRANCFYGLGERQSEEGAVHRGEWVLQSASGESVLQGWGEKLRFADAPAPYEYGKYVLDAEGSSVLAGDCVDLPGAHTEQLEAAVEAAAQAAARGEKAVRMAAMRAHGGPLAAQQAADAGGSGPAASPPPLFGAPEGAAARMMRKALTDDKQHLVDAFEAARKRDDDDAQTTTRRRRARCTPCSTRSPSCTYLTRGIWTVTALRVGKAGTGRRRAWARSAPPSRGPCGCAGLRRRRCGRTTTTTWRSTSGRAQAALCCSRGWAGRRACLRSTSRRP